VVLQRAVPRVGIERRAGGAEGGGVRVGGHRQATLFWGARR